LLGWRIQQQLDHTAHGARVGWVVEVVDRGEDGGVVGSEGADRLRALPADLAPTQFRKKIFARAITNTNNTNMILSITV
jgi:hypothetical protein